MTESTPKNEKTAEEKAVEDFRKAIDCGYFREAMDALNRIRKEELKRNKKPRNVEIYG